MSLLATALNAAAGAGHINASGSPSDRDTHAAASHSGVSSAGLKSGASVANNVVQFIRNAAQGAAAAAIGDNSSDHHTNQAGPSSERGAVGFFHRTKAIGQSGALEGVPLPRARSSVTGSRSGLESAADTLAARFGIPASLFKGVITQESQWDPLAVSPAGAKGLGQLMPATARDLGVNRKDPLSNMSGAADYLKQMFTKYGNWGDALSAYNAGPGKWDRVLEGKAATPAETQDYVSKVLVYAKQYGFGGDSTKPLSDPQVAAWFPTPAPLTPESMDPLNGVDHVADNGLIARKVKTVAIDPNTGSPLVADVSPRTMADWNHGSISSLPGAGVTTTLTAQIMADWAHGTVSAKPSQVAANDPTPTDPADGLGTRTQKLGDAFTTLFQFIKPGIDQAGQDLGNAGKTIQSGAGSATTQIAQAAPGVAQTIVTQELMTPQGRGAIIDPFLMKLFNGNKFGASEPLTEPTVKVASIDQSGRPGPTQAAADYTSGNYIDDSGVAHITVTPNHDGSSSGSSGAPAPDSAEGTNTPAPIGGGLGDINPLDPEWWKTAGTVLLALLVVVVLIVYGVHKTIQA